MINENRWINSLTKNNIKFNAEVSQLDYNKWTDTLPKKKIKKSNNKYSLSIIVFIIGIVFVTVIKNKTRNLEKDISNLKASIDVLKFDFHKENLDHEFLTSPENISILAKEYLPSDFVYYQKSQINQLNENEKILNIVKKKDDSNKKIKKISKKLKLEVSKKIEEKKSELKKLQEIYSKPEEIPKELKVRVVKRIEKTKNDLINLYDDPINSINTKKLQKWGVIQVVKVFFGIPIVPGR